MNQKTKQEIIFEHKRSLFMFDILENYIFRRIVEENDIQNLNINFDLLDIESYNDSDIRMEFWISYGENEYEKNECTASKKTYNYDYNFFKQIEDMEKLVKWFIKELKEQSKWKQHKQKLK